MKVKKTHLLPGLGMAAAAVYLAHPAAVNAQVSTADFEALRATVQSMGQQVKDLQQSNILAQQIHQQDMDRLKDLQNRLAQTQQTAADAEQKSTAVAEAQAQPMPRVPLDEATVNHNFQILGDAEVQYVDTDHQHGAFALADFAPIFLYRGGDNILFEAGFDTTLANNAPNAAGYTTTFNLSFAQLDYVMNDYLTLCAGDIILPLGVYTERGAGWLNKFPDNPLAVDAQLPGTGIGGELRGAVPLGESGSIFNYAAYIVNGPGSADGTGNASALDLGGNVGIRSDGTSANLHGNPSGGGRFALFVPFKPRWDAELGISGQAGQWDNAGRHLWSAEVLDATVHLGPNIEVRGQYQLSQFGSDDMGIIRQRGWFLQAGYKLAGLNTELPFINDNEIVGRYDSFNDGMGGNTRRYTIGDIYYLTTTLQFQTDYEFINSSNPTQPSGQLIFQLSYGF